MNTGFEKMYETQFLGFTPQSLIDGVYNSFQSYVDDAMEGLQQCIIREFPSDISKRSVELVVKEIHISIRKEIEKKFDNFEKYTLKEIFNIPTSVVLPEDKVHASQANTAEDEAAVRARIHSIENDIAAMKYETAKMEEELQTIAEVQAYCDQIREVVVGVKQQFLEAGVDDVAEMLRFISQKVHQLNELKSELAPLPTENATTCSSSVYDSQHHHVNPTIALSLLKDEAA